VAEAIRRSIFQFLETPYVPPLDRRGDKGAFAPDFLDCPITIQGDRRSLRRVVWKHFVKPIAAQLDVVRQGGKFLPETPISAIFFGPPGTSKTELTKLISEYLGWPRLTVDPSHFVRNGLDRVQAEADRLFGMLAAAERIVVLLDEFDEMVRDRARETDILSRFLTTAMLPKLANINKTRRIIFVVATNYIDHFDLAISRQGRFDLILQVMPPTAEAKLRKWTGVATNLKRIGLDLTKNRGLREQIDDLTYLEFKGFARVLETAANRDDAVKAIRAFHLNCSLMALVDPQQKPPTSWRAAMSKQARDRIRIPYA
jgi:AAA+ superfamily predicted ATPase